MTPGHLHPGQRSTKQLQEGTRQGRTSQLTREPLADARLDSECHSLQPSPSAIQLHSLTITVHTVTLQQEFKQARSGDRRPGLPHALEAENQNMSESESMKMKELRAESMEEDALNNWGCGPLVSEGLLPGASNVEQQEEDVEMSSAVSSFESVICSNVLRAILRNLEWASLRRCLFVSREFKSAAECRAVWCHRVHGVVMELATNAATAGTADAGSSRGGASAPCTISSGGSGSPLALLHAVYGGCLLQNPHFLERHNLGGKAWVS